MSRFLRFCAFLFVLFFTGNVLAAGYSCPTTSYKKYTSCSAGYYMTYNGTYNGTPQVGNACTKCASNEYCAGGTANKKYICSAGYYLPANLPTCRICPGGSYCPGGTFGVSSSDQGIHSCPPPNDSNTDSLSDMMVWIKDACPTVTSEEDIDGITYGLTTWGEGAKTINECKANYVVTTPCGSIRKDSVPFNSTNNTYDTYTGNSNTTYDSSYERGDRYFRTLTAGYYFTEPYNTTYCTTTDPSKKNMYYKKAAVCPGGGVYCPGFTDANYPKCNDSAWHYGDPIGMYGCETGAASTGDGDGDGYWYSDTGAGARTGCFVSVSLNKNGGSGSLTGVQTCHYNTPCTLPDASGLTQTGYKFSGGWATTASGTSCSNSITLTSAAATPTYYACKVSARTITLNNRSATTPGTTAIYQTYNTNVYLDSDRSKIMTTSANAITVPSRTGYTFGGYYSASDGTGTQYINASGNITSDGLTAGKALQANGTWYAKWTANDYQIGLDSNDATANGTTSIYTTYNTNVYLDSDRTKVMTASANNINVPARIYTVTYDTSNGGSIDTPYVTKSYSFQGYYNSTSGGTQYINASGNITSDGLTAAKGYSGTTTWFAQWNSGAAAVTLPTLTRTGYTFTGWNTQKNGSGTNYAAGASYTPTANVTLYAQWTPNVYKVTFKDTTGQTTYQVAYYKYMYAWYSDAAATQQLFGLNEQSNLGYTFAGFSKSQYCPSGPTAGITTSWGLEATLNIESDTVLYACWTPNTYTITLDDNGGYGGSGTAKEVYNTRWTNGSGTTISAVTVPTRSGYVFTGYYTAKSGGNRRITAAGGLPANTTFTSNTTLYAQWTANTYTITLDNANATTNGTSSIYIVRDDAIYLDSDKTKEMTGSANPITVPQRKYTVTYNANSGSVSPASATSTYTFNGYYIGGSPRISYSGYVIDDQIGYLTATTNSAETWNAQWTGGVVTLPTPTREGYTFGGWYSNSSLTTKVGDAGASYTPTANVTLYAKWTANTYTISFDANGGTGGQSANVTATYDSAMPTISTTKPTKAGCKFNGWYDATSGGTQYYTAAGESARTWNKTANTTLSAQWSCMSVTGPSNQSKVYDGAALTCNGGISVSAPSGATVTYATQSSGTCGTYDAAPTRTAAGTTTVCYKISASGYTDKTGTFTCSVTQANGSTTIKDGSTDVTNKSGSTVYPGTKSLTITCAGGATSNITATSGTASVATTSVSGTSVTLTSKATGSSKITVDCPATTNYKASSATYDWTVTDGTISVSKSDKSKTYDGSALTCNGLTVNSPSSTTVEYSTDGGSTWSTTVPSRTNAGTTTVNYRVSKTNYTTVTGSFSCTVNNATMTVSASDKTLTYNGTTTSNGTAQSCANVTVSVPSSGAAVKYNTDGSSTYNSTAPTLTNTGSTTVYYQVTASNYTTKTGSYKCTMNPKAMTVSAGNKTKVYDGSALTCSVSVSVPSDGATIKYGTSSDSYTLTSAPTQTNVGSQTVYYQVTGSNFTTKTGSFNCSVTKATMNASLAGNSRTYSGLPLTCNGGTQTGVPSRSTITYSTTEDGEYSSTIPTRTNAGTTTVYYKIQNSNYNDFTGSFSCKVNKAAGTTAIKEGSTTVTSGIVRYPNKKTLTITCSGGATISSATSGTTDVATVANSGNTVTVTPVKQGSSVITVTCPATDNYTESSKTYDLTVYRGTCTISVSPTSGTIKIPTTTSTFTVDSGSCNGALSVDSNNTDVATVSLSNKTGTVTWQSAGLAMITVTAAQTDQYEVTKAYYPVTTQKGDITATVTNPSKTYNGGALSCAGISNVVPSGATVSYAEKSGTTCGTYSSTIPSRTNAGTTNVCYKIEATNYTTKSGEFSCTVNQAENTLTLSATSGSMPYSSTATFTVSTNTSGGTLSVTSSNENCATATISGTTVTISSKANYCTANITVTSAATTNYTTKSATYALTVNKGTITLNNRSATSAGTTAIYQTYNNNVYLDNARSKAMTTSANAITVPSRTGYTFGGYYSASDGTGTQYINASGNITSDGLTTGKALQANGTWYAKWTANNYTITLDNASATTNGTASIYTTYNTNVYLDSSRSKAMTTSANPITKPSRVYTVTYNANSGSVSPTSATSTYTFKGYYSATSNGTQYINASGNITSDGLTAGKGYSAAKTWNAQWTSAAVTLPTPTRTGYTFGGWYKESALTNKVGDAGASYTPTANVTLYAKWTANTDTKYVVNYYTKNLGATTYTLNSTENKTGTTATSVTLADLKKTITGFTYSEGFAGTATKGTTKPTSGAVTTATILADGTRVIDLYYTRNTYTITVAAGNGISKVAASGWTNTGSANMTKSYEYGASIALATVVTPTQKTGYTGVAYTKTSGSGTLSGTSFTVGAGAATITAKATAISAPTAALDPASTTKVYNYQATTLTASNTTSYDSGITVYYKFGNATAADGTYTYGDVGTTNTTSVGATSHRGTKYYKVQVYATDGTLTSSTTTSSAASVTLNNKTITFNATDNGGTLSGTSPLYVSYNNASVYTGSTNTTAGTVPTATKTGYTFNGWYTEKTGGSQIYNASGTLTSAAVSGYTSGSKWVATENKTLYAQFTPCTYTVKFNSNKPSTATSTMSGTMSNQSFTYDAAQNLTANAFSLPGYTFAGWATSSTGSVAHADKKSVSNLTTTCGGTVNLYAKWTANTITLSWANGGRGTAPTSPASCTYDGTFTTPAAMTATGYTFGGWSVNSKTFAVSTSVACTNANLGVYSGTATITGKWTANTYTIVYNANKPSAASASVSGSTASSTHTYDTAKALTSNGFSLTGWSFAGWNTLADGSGTSYSNGASVKNLSATKGATVNLYAKWTQDCIPVTLDANGGTAGSVTKIYKKADATGWYSDSACATAYITNANLKPSRSAYMFRGFYVEPVDDISASQTTAITRYLLSDASTSTTGTNWKINAARTLYAGWAKTCVQPSNGTCEFSHGDKAVYTTTCNTGYSIGGNATATPSCSIITYTIKYMDGSAEITGLTPASYNVTTATFNLPTAYKATYKFASWHTDSALSSTAVTQIAKGTTGNKVYYVKWSTCPAGSVCDGDDVVTCPAGSYCSAGSSEATPCAKGSYSTGGATTCTFADKGYYVDTTGATEQIACPAGTYGSTTGLTSAACSGKCSAGRYGNATAQTAATCNGPCSAGYYCPAGSTSATAYDCDTGTTTASSNNYWTSDSGAGARSSCYRNVVLNKNGMSGTLALPDSSGCKSLDTSTNTLAVYHNTACKLPTTVLSGTATGTTYTGTGTWATSANAASGFVSSITVTSEAATVTYYAGKMYTCSAGYYLKANTNGACTACASPYYCTGISKKYYSSSIQGRSACSALDSAKTDGTYSSVSPYDAATTCRFKQEQQTVPTYCETKASNTMKYTSNGWEANTYSVTAKSGAIISGNNTTGATCGQCAAGTYSAGGTDTTCDAISAGCYGGAGSATACPNQCSAGTYRTSTGGKTQSDCSNVTAGCYGSAGATKACPAVCATNNYSNAGASACTPCDSDYANSGDTAESHAGVASCKVTCAAGKYVAEANAACSDVGSGYYTTASQTISQGNKGSRNACSSLNAFYMASDSGRDAATDCYGTTTSTKFVKTAKSGEETCTAGGYCPGSVKVYYNSTGGRTACAAGTANPNTGSSASSACVTCVAGTYNTTTGNTSCSTCPANSYCTGGTNKTACNTVAGKLYTKSAEGSGAATDCYVTLASKVYLAKPTDTATTTCTAGYYCAGGDYHYSSTATNQGRSSCTGATYSGAGAASCSDCPSGYTANTSSNKTANTQCQISVDGGHFIEKAGQNSTNWGTCAAGYAKAAHTVNYGSTSSCAACTGPTYAENAGQASCTACPTATKYADKVKGYTYWIADNIHDTEDGCRAVMKTTELLHGDLSSTSMDCFIKNGDYGDGKCEITASHLTCDGGYYLNSTGLYPNWIGYDNAVANACTSVGTGYWSAEGDRTRTACATGLTTCGSGKCANEAADCGRKLHAGDKVIHLRSAERTRPSLRVKVGDTVFYGNLVSPVDGTLKVKNGTSTYSVANDNQ